MKIFPNYISGKAINYYIVLLLLISFMFFNNMMPLLWWLFGVVAVVAFFNGSQSLINSWSKLTEKRFLKKLFWTAFIIRAVYAIIMYFLYWQLTGTPFEFLAGDASFYDSIAAFGADRLLEGKFDLFTEFRSQDSKINFSDMGYPYMLSVIYVFVFKSILLARIVKAVLGAWMCVLIYKIAIRNFNEKVAHMSAIFCMLMPNFIYYTGLHVKESEMVFLTVWFIERADYLMRGKDFTIKAILPILLIGGSLFTFRTALGATAMFSLFTTVFLTSKRVLKMQKKVVLGIWVIVTIGFFIGGTISTEIEQLWNARAGVKEAGMKEMETREGGNSYVKYIAGISFAPLIFVVPLPTMINISFQQNQQLLHGGYYVKNIMAFFVIIALYTVIKQKRWRDYLLMGSFVIGYLLVISFSRFAASERFHLPALPFFLILAAYGITQVTNKQKNYYNWWVIFIFVIIVGWNWFKLAGRGMT